MMKTIHFASWMAVKGESAVSLINPIQQVAPYVGLDPNQVDVFDKQGETVILTRGDTVQDYRLLNTVAGLMNTVFKVRGPWSYIGDGNLFAGGYNDAYVKIGKS